MTTASKQIMSSVKLCLLNSQLVPVYPGLQLQMYEFPLALQVPPFLHGLLEHGSEVK